MSDIFICYSRQDLNTANKLIKLLEAEGWTVFIDRKTHVGRRWNHEIEKELHACKAVVVLWSSSSRDSDYVLEEANHGRLNNILFPALIEKVKLPYGFGFIQTVDLTGWAKGKKDTGLTDLINALRLHLNESIAETSSTENTDLVRPTHETTISVESDTTKHTPPAKTIHNWSPRKKFLSVSVLMLLAFASFPVIEWFYEKDLPPIDESVVEFEAGHKAEPAYPNQISQSETDYPEDELLTAPIEDTQTGKCDFPDKQSLPTLAAIPTGSFYSSLFEKQLEISTLFCLSKYEITYEQYDFYVEDQLRNNHEVKKPETADGGRGESTGRLC